VRYLAVTRERGPAWDTTREMADQEAWTEDAVHARLAADPWTEMGLLRVADVVPWLILLGER
jgi:hypothetical protein